MEEVTDSSKFLQVNVNVKDEIIFTNDDNMVCQKDV